MTLNSLASTRQNGICDEQRTPLSVHGGGLSALYLSSGEQMESQKGDVSGGRYCSLSQFSLGLFRSTDLREGGKEAA